MNFREKQNRSETTRVEDEEKVFVPVKIPSCEKNEKVKTVFRLKDQNQHRGNVIYQGTSIKNQKYQI